ncbi:MAG: very short patch repair endonuclease [Chthoniobacterales bacterium]
MSRIRSKGNLRTEMRLVTLLRRSGITGWRRHHRVLGNPDFVFRSQRIAIFVDGCFWHGCPRCKRIAKTNRRFWTEKIRRNRSRDRTNTARLRQKGWAVIRVWEHDLTRPGPLLRALQRQLARRI